MKWFILFLTGVFPLFAAYVGNPAEPALMNMGLFSSSYPFFKFTSGYIADYISDKRYAAQQKNAILNPNQAFRHFGLHSQMGSFSLIFIERLELFGRVGGTKEHTHIKKHPTRDDFTAVLTDLHTAHHFSWSTGGKIVLIQWGQTFFSTDFTYFAIPSSPKSFFKYINRLDIPMDLTKKQFYLREWQLSAGLSSRFLFITPYIGATYLNSLLHVKQSANLPAINYRNDVKFGYFYGVTVSLTGRFHLNFERRLRDEFAYALSTIVVF